MYFYTANNKLHRTKLLKCTIHAPYKSLLIKKFCGYFYLWMFSACMVHILYFIRCLYGAFMTKIIQRRTTIYPFLTDCSSNWKAVWMNHMVLKATLFCVWIGVFYRKTMAFILFYNWFYSIPVALLLYRTGLPCLLLLLLSSTSLLSLLLLLLSSTSLLCELLLLLSSSSSLSPSIIYVSAYAFAAVAAVVVVVVHTCLLLLLLLLLLLPFHLLLLLLYRAAVSIQFDSTL